MFAFMYVYQYTYMLITQRRFQYKCIHPLARNVGSGVFWGAYLARNQHHSEAERLPSPLASTSKSLGREGTDWVAASRSTREDDIDDDDEENTTKNNTDKTKKKKQTIRQE